MIENWIEGIKRNDEMTMLDRYFPEKNNPSINQEKE